MNRTKVKVWYTTNRIWTEQRINNGTYMVSNDGHEITLHELFKNYTPRPWVY